MSEIRVLVNGAKGRMGTEAVQAVIGADGLELVGQTDLGDELSSAIADTGAQVVVDFTIPSAAVHNANLILDSGASPVVGTTGFSVEEIEALQEKAAGLERGGVIAPNFAIGAVLLMKFAQKAAKYLPDVEVIELHHDQKVDAPSGTALKTVELIRESLDQNPSAQHRKTGRDRDRQRGPGRKIPQHSCSQRTPPWLCRPRRGLIWRHRAGSLASPRLHFKGIFYARSHPRHP